MVERGGGVRHPAPGVQGEEVSAATETEQPTGCSVFYAGAGDEIPERPCGGTKSVRKIAVFLLGLLLTTGPTRALERGPASDLMRQCEALICAEKERRGLFDPEADPGRSGLIGVEFSPLTTSLGELADKRAAARPEMADAVAEYLRRAGVASGDWVAVNASASFPGFCLAALCAAETLGVHVQFVFSYGSSMYGGTQPEFTFPVMLDLLNASGLLRTRLRAVAPGGAWDRMGEVLLEDPLPTLRVLLDSRCEEKIEAAGLAEAIRRRLEIFGETPLPIRCFVNCGGAWTSMGLSERVLEVGYGLLERPVSVPQGNERGLIFEYLERGVPVVHLLYAKGICRDFGIPYGEE